MICCVEKIILESEIILTCVGWIHIMFPLEGDKKAPSPYAYTYEKNNGMQYYDISVQTA